MKVYRVSIMHPMFGTLIDQPIAAASAAEAAAEGILLAFSGAGTFEGPSRYDVPIGLADLVVKVRFDLSGQTISPGPEWKPHVPAAAEPEKPPIPPLPDRTGGISGYSCPEYFPGRDALPTPDQSFSYYCDLGEGHEGPHHNANVGTWLR